MTHTPRLWTLEAGRCIVTPHGRFTLNKCNDYDPNKVVELDEAARLIASAPDMLDALRIAADIQHETSNQRGEVDCTEKTPCLFCSTIAHAEGQP